MLVIIVYTSICDSAEQLSNSVMTNPDNFAS